MAKRRIPLIAVVGTSKTGKTTFIERLIPFFRRKGLRIATIKHHHLDFEFDREGKDTYRHKLAGSSTVVLSSPRKLAFVKDLEAEMPLREIVSSYIDDADLVIVEGYKKENVPKIEVFSRKGRRKPLCTDDSTILALVTDAYIDTEIPRFSTDDIEGVAAFIAGILRLSIRNGAATGGVLSRHR